jgi:hypothetical protein
MEAVYHRLRRVAAWFGTWLNVEALRADIFGEFYAAHS